MMSPRPPPQTNPTSHHCDPLDIDVTTFRALLVRGRVGFEGRWLRRAVGRAVEGWVDRRWHPAHVQMQAPGPWPGSSPSCEDEAPATRRRGRLHRPHLILRLVVGVVIIVQILLLQMRRALPRVRRMWPRRRRPQAPRPAAPRRAHHHKGGQAQTPRARPRMLRPARPPAPRGRAAVLVGRLRSEWGPTRLRARAAGLVRFGGNRTPPTRHHSPARHHTSSLAHTPTRSHARTRPRMPTARRSPTLAQFEPYLVGFEEMNNAFVRYMYQCQRASHRRFVEGKKPPYGNSNTG